MCADILLQSRRPKAAKNARLGQKVAKAPVVGKWCHVSFIKVGQQPLSMFLKLCWRCLGGVKFSACIGADMMPEVLPTYEGFSTMTTCRFPFNCISSYVQGGSSCVQNPVNKQFMTSQGIEKLKGLPTLLTVQSSLCKWELGLKVQIAKVLKP